MYQVVGYDEAGEPVYQPVAGSVLGDGMDGAVLGYGPTSVIGARHMARHHGHRPMMALPPRAPWRGHELAHGVNSPDTGMFPLPMSGTGGTNTFTATVGNITFQGSIQKPYRSERLIFIVTRVGASATVRCGFRAGR